MTKVTWFVETKVKLLYMIGASAMLIAGAAACLVAIPVALLTVPFAKVRKDSDIYKLSWS